MIVAGVSGAGCTAAMYLYLSNDAGNGWVGSYYLGWATSIQNSQCKVHLGNSSLTKSGNQVTVSLRIEFFAGYAGSYNWYMLSTDWQGNMTSWDDRGDWTVGTGGGGGGAGPQLSNVAPGSGSGLGPQTFTVTVTDAQGAGNVKEVALLTSAGAMNVAQSCYFYIWANNPGTPVLYLVDDAGTGTLGSYYVGWPNTTMQNSQCRIDLGASTWSRSGNVFTVGLRVTFFAGYAGAKNWWAWASDWDGHTVGWTDVGDWTVGSGGDVTPPVISGVGHGGVTSSGATVSWATNEASDSQVQFGNSTAYGSYTVLNGALVTSHSVFVPAAPVTTVYYKVWSRNAAAGRRCWLNGRLEAGRQGMRGSRGNDGPWKARRVTARSPANRRFRSFRSMDRNMSSISLMSLVSNKRRRSSIHRRRTARRHPAHAYLPSF